MSSFSTLNSNLPLSPTRVSHRKLAEIQKQDWKALTIDEKKAGKSPVPRSLIYTPPFNPIILLCYFSIRSRLTSTRPTRVIPALSLGHLRMSN